MLAGIGHFVKIRDDGRAAEDMVDKSAFFSYK